MATRTASAQAAEQAKPSIAKQLLRLLRLAGPWSGLLYGTAVMGLFISIAGVVSADLSARLTNTMFAGDMQAFSLLVLPAVLVRVGELVLDSLQKLTNGKFGQETMHRLRCEVESRLSRMTASAASRAHSGETISRLTSDLAGVGSLLQDELPAAFTRTAQAVFALAYMLWRNWTLALIAVFGTPFVFALVGRLNRPVMALSKRAQEVLAKTNEVTSESLAGAEIVRSYGLQERMYATFSKHAGSWQEISKRNSRLVAFASAIGFGASFTPFILIFGIGGFMVLRSQIQIGVLLAFMDLLNYVTFPMQELPRLLAQMSSNAASAERVLDLLDVPVERQDGDDFSPDPSAPVIEFRNVTFAYPGALAPALRDVSFVVNPGEVVAIAGPSGSGKSTVFRLLLGDYDPDCGEILVFGHSLREWSPAFLRSHFSVVSQDTYLFPFSVGENLRLDKTDLDDERLVLAARLAQADSFIEALPHGYDTPVGELGKRVSGGQRQRLSLARAFLRPADILLLDEATSALDYRAERQVIEGIRDSEMGLATLVIAHRLSSVRHASKTLVFVEGELAECGTHDELIALHGKYRQLYGSQREGGVEA